MRDRTLLAVTEVTDDDTGRCTVGGYDTTVDPMRLRERLRHDGESGRKEIIKRLEYLIRTVNEIAAEVSR